MAKVTTLKGKQIDIGALQETYGATVALGNARMNARGDILGKGGQIEKTREQSVRDYYDRNPKAVTVSTVSLKDIADENIMTPAEAIAALEEKKATATKRRFKDSED